MSSYWRQQIESIFLTPPSFDPVGLTGRFLLARQISRAGERKENIISVGGLEMQSLAQISI